MERQILGRVRGGMWYSGDGITGSSTTPAVFSGSGVTKAYEGDLFVNLDSGYSGRGNVYSCTTGGDADTAEWAYVGTILGPLPDVVDALTSESTVYALSARQGKVLKGLIDDSGIYPNTVKPDCSTEVATISLTMEDKDTTITVTETGGTTATYSYTGTDTGADIVLTLAVTDLFSESTIAVDSINSSDAAIKSYVLYDANTAQVYSETPSVWGHILNDEENIEPSGATITDGTDTIPVAAVTKLIDAVRTAMAVENYAKAVWYSKTDGETVYDKLAEFVEVQDMINNNLYYASIVDDDGNIIVDDDGNEILGDWSYAIA